MNLDTVLESLGENLNANWETYDKLYATVRVTYGGLLADETMDECDLLEGIVQLYYKWVEEIFGGKILKLTCGVDYWSDKDKIEKDIDKNTKSQIFGGDKCRNHIHIMAVIGNLPNGVLNIIRDVRKHQKGKKEGLEITSVGDRLSSFGMAKWTKLLWDTGYFSNKWRDSKSGGKNWKYHTLETKLESDFEDNEERFLSYAVKQFMKHEVDKDGNKNLVNKAKSLCFGFDGDNLDVMIKYRGMETINKYVISQKKKMSIQSKRTSSWFKELANYVQEHADKMDKRTVRITVLEYFIAQQKPFLLTDVLKNANLILATLNDDELDAMKAELLAM